MQLKIQNIDNDLGITFPLEIINKLNLKEGDIIDVIETAEGIELNPHIEEENISFDEATKEIAGSLDWGPGDLATHKKLDQLLETVQHLTPKEQKDVLEFIAFLQYKKQKPEIEEAKENPISAYEAAKAFAGCVDSGIGDLSYNKKYLEGPLI